ncbi:hypothetical protein [Salmonella enterica]|uniref:hypothetical protein n=1 Tax=Salmonella enterica TaxID=28901 RepID=UPI00370B83CA
MLTKKEIVEAIGYQINISSDLLDIRELMVFFKNKGITKAIMLECLNDLRVTSNEDVILELMDFVEGYCNPDLAIYP